MKKIFGEIGSISQVNLYALEKLYELKIPTNEFLTLELANNLMYLSQKINREVAIYIDRKGNIKIVSIGSYDLVNIPQMTFKRGESGYSGLRCIHTHPNGNCELSTPDLTALINLKLDFIAAISVEKNPRICTAYLTPVKGSLTNKYEVMGPLTIAEFIKVPLLSILVNFEKQLQFKGHLTETNKERALLVIVEWSWQSLELEEIKNELINLSSTAGLEVVDVLIQKRDKKDSAFLIGQGKLKDISLLIQEKEINCVIFEDQLSPSQLTNLINVLGVKILDRTNLILDIFAQRAKSKEGKIQIELAQLSYMLPRLTGQGLNLSRLGGGVGTRGPGETKLETDRRHIHRRIDFLKAELEDIKKHRNILQKNRTEKEFPTVALVGYTNAGKSSLLNKLANENTLVEDKLFATLDTTTRLVKLNDAMQHILLTDTVGFIRNLPHQLISAFKSTLEEVKLADLLLHVTDVTSENMEDNIKTVENVLQELEVSHKKTIFVFNKIDKLDKEPQIPLKSRPYCLVSTHSGSGIDQLKELIVSTLWGHEIFMKIHIPFEKGDLLEKAFQTGKVEIVGYNQSGTEIKYWTYEGKVPRQLEQYLIMEK
ncbi:MAG: GTPase HflX [Bacillota bacterium]